MKPFIVVVCILEFNCNVMRLIRGLIKYILVRIKTLQACYKETRAINKNSSNQVLKIRSETWSVN